MHSIMRRFLVVSFWLTGFTAMAQDNIVQGNIGLTFYGFRIHPTGDENAPLMPLRLDDNGVLVINLGGMLSYEKFVYADGVSVKAVQGIYSDCAAQLGGFSHIGLRARIFKTGKHSLYGGIGP